MAKSGDNTEVVSAIDAASQKYGIDPNALLTIAYIETGGTFDAWAKNPSSSAKGAFQFISSTGKEYGLYGDDAYNIEKAADAAARMYLQNEAYLKKVLGRDPTVGEMYLSWQQGAAGAAQILTNPSGGNAVKTLGYDQVYKNLPRRQGESQKAFEDRVNRITLGEFGQLWTDKADTVSQTRLPPGYIRGRNQDTGAYQGLIPGSPLSGFFGVDPRPSTANSANLAYARQAADNRRPVINPAMPQYRTSNTAVPLPRPTFTNAPYGTRDIAPQQQAAVNTQLADRVSLQNVMAPSMTAPTGGVITRAQQAAISAVPNAPTPSFAYPGGTPQYPMWTPPATKSTSAPGAGVTQAQMQAIRAVGTPTSPVAQIPSGITKGVSTTYGDKPAVTYSGSPTNRPTSSATYFAPTPTGSANANLTSAKEEKKQLMKPTTVTRTIMVPNPAYIPPAGYANTPTGGYIKQSQLDAIRGVPANAYQKPIPKAVPKMIPKTVTQTVMRPVEITVYGGKVAPPPATTKVEQLKQQGMSSAQAYDTLVKQQNESNANSKGGNAVDRMTVQEQKNYDAMYGGISKSLV